MDLISIIILAFIVNGVRPPNFLGSLMIAFFGYGFFKAIPLLYFGGVTFPLSKDPELQFWSGMFGFVVVASIFYYAILRQNNPQLPPIHKIWKLLRGADHARRQ